MSTAPKRRLTETEYLSIERAAETRSEFYQGEMFAMAGASREHILITLNLGSELRAALKGRCETYVNEMRVKVGGSGLYSYPDVAVACGNPRFEDADVDTLLNPTVLIEVLSDSTEAYDRGMKFQQYRQLASLREYVLVSQKTPLCERYLRQGSDAWMYLPVMGLDGSLHLESIDVRIPMSEIYLSVKFTETPATPAPHAPVDQ
jgi:Uma2 family endonuclease